MLLEPLQAACGYTYLFEHIEISELLLQFRLHSRVHRLPCERPRPGYESRLASPGGEMQVILRYPEGSIHCA